MTDIHPTATAGERGIGWVPLGPGVEMSRHWLSSRTPQLFAAWQQAHTAQQQLRLAELIQRVADATRPHTDEEREMTELGQQLPEDEWVNLRVVVAETTRYEMDLYVSPHLNDDELRTEIAMARQDHQYRTLPTTDEDNRILSIATLVDDNGDRVVDLDGDGRISGFERSVANLDESPPTDYGDLADSINERLAEGPEWAALNAALGRAAAAGYDVEGRLPLLAAQEPLPVRQPAQELHYRLMADCDAALSTPAGPDPQSSNPSAASQSARRAETPVQAPARGQDAPPR